MKINKRRVIYLLVSIGLFAVPQIAGANPPTDTPSSIIAEEDLLTPSFFMKLWIVTMILEVVFMILLTQADRLKQLKLVTLTVVGANIISFPIFTLYQRLFVMPFTRLHSELFTTISDEMTYYLHHRLSEYNIMMYLLLILLGEIVVVLFETGFLYTFLKKYFSFKKLFFFTALVNVISFFIIAIVNSTFSGDIEVLAVTGFVVGFLALMGANIANKFAKIENGDVILISSFLVYGVGAIFFLPLSYGVEFFPYYEDLLNVLMIIIFPLVASSIIFIRFNINRYHLTTRQIIYLLGSINSLILGLLIMLMLVTTGLIHLTA